MIGQDEVVLWIVDGRFEYEAKQRRDRDKDAVFPVGDVSTPDDVEALRVAMGYQLGAFDLERARYHKVCIVAAETSPVRTWVASFFAEEMPALVMADGLYTCEPPFDRGRAVVLRQNG